jgi:hypothetical protein
MSMVIMVILASSTSPLVLFILSFITKNDGVPIRGDANNLFGNEVVTNNICEEKSPSRWQSRTAKRRQRTEELLLSVEMGGLPILPLLSVPSAPSNSLFSAGITPILNIPPASIITWDTIHPELDPMRGGKIIAENSYKSNNNIRGIRKRGQVQAFHFILSSILNAYYNANTSQSGSGGIEGVTIIDAGCGAGNLAIALAGLLRFPTNNSGMNLNILAVDVNEEALNRLSQRVAQETTSLENNNSQKFIPSQSTITTCCADLANYEYIQSHIPSHHDVIVVSLHACGAASDMAMNLAYQCNNAPFVICPCCTAKSLTRRDVNDIISNDENSSVGDTEEQGKQNQQFFINPQASYHRSGATPDILYPRSNWLTTKLLSSASRYRDDGYALLAKVADVGLGPQTPTQQREQQRRAKRIIELDRLMSASERQFGYDTRLMRIQDQDDDPQIYSYGKGEVLLGALKGSLASNVMLRLPSV